MQPPRADRKASRHVNHPRGASAGMASVIRQAAGSIGWDASTLLDWKVYPDRVVLISADGRKAVLPRDAMGEKENEVSQ